MLISFFFNLRNHNIPVTVKEFLDLLQALDKQLAFASTEQFYYIARTCLVKDEKYFDRYDQAFEHYFQDLESVDDLIAMMIPDDWLREAFLRELSEQDKAAIESLGSLEKLLDTFAKRLEQQQSRHQGGNKWIGTGGTSPFGHGGYNPEGIRIGGPGRHNKAVKVWQQRQYRNLDHEREIGTRNIKMALRRLRQFARQGARQELDLDETIRSTARNAGLLDIQWIAERHNVAKVLLFFDVGGSMDPYVEMCEQLFSAARTEFKHLEYYYFHNFIYEAVWQNNIRRHTERADLLELCNTYGSDYRVIFIGDASMSPYEILYPGGSVDHWNEEAGEVWMRRLLRHFEKAVWINPVPAQHWQYTQSIEMVDSILDGHMYPLTLAGLEQAMSYLSR